MKVSLQPYGNGSTGVAAFAILHGGMIVRFRDGRTYLYDEVSPGRKHLERMQALAHAGSGLTTYINQHVRENYVGRLGD